MAFVVVHIAALIWHESKDKTPLAQSMVSGYQYEIEPPVKQTVEQTKEQDHA
jgi:cytochrome b